MADLHVVTHANKNLYEDVLEEYFRLRHKIYVDERRWMELAKPDGREIDQFDTPDTVYLMAMEGRRVVGSHRLVPTIKPTLMSDLFPQLAIRGLIRRPDAYELSRVFVIRERRGEQAQPRVESVIMAGTMEYAIAQGISQFTIVMETWWLPRFQDLGWRLRPLGLPTMINGMNCIGVVADVNEEIWVETCTRRSVPGTVLVWNGLEPAMPEPRVAAG
jgi:acyl-homoserine lactone synthase